MVEGGPGYASTNFDTAKSVGAVFAPLLRRRELVLIDQRGTGGSQAVFCGALQRDGIPLQLATAECANQLGPRAAGFTSAESAADIEAVRLALGLQNVVLYGDSYGTLLEQAYAVRYGAQPRRPDPLLRLPGGRPVLAHAVSGRGAGAAAAMRPRSRTAMATAPLRFREVLRRFLAAGGPVNDLLEFLLDNGGTWAPYSYRNLNRATAAFLGGNKGGC